MPSIVALGKLDNWNPFKETNLQGRKRDVRFDNDVFVQKKHGACINYRLSFDFAMETDIQKVSSGVGRHHVPY